MTRQVVPGSTVEYAKGGGPDLRCYRVDGRKLARMFPDLRLRWTARDGIERLYAAYQSQGLPEADLTGPRYLRIGTIQGLLAAGRLDSHLRWTKAAEPVAIPAASGSTRT
jgi:hypothetical protein